MRYAIDNKPTIYRLYDENITFTTYPVPKENQNDLFILNYGDPNETGSLFIHDSI
jgi:hypothetical protein